MKTTLLTGYFLPREKKEQQSLPVEIKSIRTGESLGTDRQIQLTANGEVFLTLSLSDKGWLTADFTEPVSVGLQLSYKYQSGRKFHCFPENRAFEGNDVPKWE